ncbi:MAG TPA: hypothetical protein VFW03_23215 [Gemmatimonadaceae bacterium]|nr:hypothetical protein [Gemmatimonadaceae bacterium]
MTDYSYVPTLPIANRPCTVFVQLQGPSSNYVRVWCVAAPEGSSLASRITSGNSRALVYEGVAGINAPWRFTFDRGGRYQLLSQEYIQDGGWGGGYEDDPRGAPTETKNGDAETDDFYVMQRMTQQLGVGDDRATLLLYVGNTTIRQTLLAVHGENSPAVTGWTSDRAAAAAKLAAVTSAAAALIDTSAATSLGSLGSIVDAMIGKFVAHANNGGGTWHQNADSQTDLGANYVGSTALVGIASAINKLRLRFSQHIQNSKENDATHPEYQIPGGITIHDQSSLKFDLKNALLPVTADANDPPSIYAAIGDFWRAYEAHRTAAMHETSDTTNTLTALTGIPLLHKEFMASLAAIAPTPPPGQSTGAATLIGTGGFVET